MNYKYEAKGNFWTVTCIMVLPAFGAKLVAAVHIIQHPVSSIQPLVYLPEQIVPEP
jgi:hypothetical protein